MPTLASILKAEVRRLASREIQRAFRRFRRVQRQVKALKKVVRVERRHVASALRRIDRLKALAPRFARGESGGPRFMPQSVRSLRARLKMTRLQFAKLLSVSPGSIFGWETGRTLPRGKSRARIAEARGLGAREARARIGKPAGKRKRPRRRRRRG